MTVFDLRASDAPALIDVADGTTLSYRGLLDRNQSIAETLGPARGLVLIACRNDSFSASMYVAALEAGHAVGLVDGTGRSGPQPDLIDRYRPGWLIGPAGHAEMWRESGLPVRRVEPSFGGELVQLDYAPGPMLHPDLAVLLMTSGTTGSRQMVRLSASNIGSNARSIARFLGLGPDERPVSSLPLHYSFGLSVLNSHLAAGASIALTTESVLQRSFWDSVREWRCTSLAGVPYTYQMLERIGYRDMSLPALTTMQQAGGSLDRDLIATYGEHMAAKNGRLFVMYGQTEATARMAFVPPDELHRKLGSAGIPIPGGRFLIRGAEGGAAAGTTGEIIYHGPNVMLGYATGAADLAAGDELGGALATGDLGRLDADGYLYLIGRSKRIAKVFGLRINLDEVEGMLEGHGPIAVVEGSDAIWAFGAFDDEATTSLARSLAQRLRLHPRAVHVRSVPDIPTLSSGKIDYSTVARWTQS